MKTHVAAFSSVMQAASMAHEISEPLTGIVAGVSACIGRLTLDPPDIKGACETAMQSLREAKDAAQSITRLCAALGWAPQPMEPRERHHLPGGGMAPSRAQPMVLPRVGNINLFREIGIESIRETYASLSRREREVMVLVVTGLRNKQVAAELGISEITVKAHRGRVMRKMKAKSICDLVRMASRMSTEPLVMG